MRLTHKSIAILDRSSIGEARRAAVSLAQGLGFNEARTHDIGIAATESATNVLLHAGTGELLLCPAIEAASCWLDLVALDSGPGIANIDRAMEDGYSTAGTAGQGLGAIARLADSSSLYSAAGKGVASWMRFAQGSARPLQAIGVVNIPQRGEVECGDSFLVQLGESSSTYMVVDGLGHGAGASEAAREAVLTAERYKDAPLPEILERSHDALRKTRGAAMSMARIDHDRLTVVAAGIGNVSSMLVSGTAARTLLTQNGTLGAALPRLVQEYTYPIERTTLLIMFSDGLNTKLSLGGYAGLQSRHPALIAAVLYRDFTRRRDDATVLVARIGGVGA